MTIATIASPIISAIAIIVALWISKQSSREAKLQLHKLSDMLETFIAVENVKLVSIKQENEKALADLEPKIKELQDKYSIRDIQGNSNIEIVGKVEDKLHILTSIQDLVKKKEDLELEKKLIIDYLMKVQQSTNK